MQLGSAINCGKCNWSIGVDGRPFRRGSRKLWRKLFAVPAPRRIKLYKPFPLVHRVSSSARVSVTTSPVFDASLKISWLDEEAHDVLTNEAAARSENAAHT